jgi:hypothetical protein
VLVWLTFRDAAGVMRLRGDPDYRLIEISDEDARRLVVQAERGMTNGLDPAPERMDLSPTSWQRTRKPSSKATGSAPETKCWSASNAPATPVPSA